MRSNLPQIEALISGTVDARLEDSGLRLVGGIMGEIAEQGLVDTTRMIDDIQHHVEGLEVRAGSTIDDPPYPFFLNNGFTHWITEELVGPYRFMEKGVARVEGNLRDIWKEPVRGKL